MWVRGRIITLTLFIKFILCEWFPGRFLLKGRGMRTVPSLRGKSSWNHPNREIKRKERLNTKIITRNYYRKLWVKIMSENYEWKLWVKIMSENYQWKLSVKIISKNYQWKLSVKIISENYQWKLSANISITRKMWDL